MKLRGNYLLVKTDGYGIEVCGFFNTEDEAIAEMYKEYNDYAPNDWNEDWKDESYCTDVGALLYDNGENVYAWNIICLTK